MPESITMGMSNTIAESRRAMSWVVAMVDMSRPSDRARIIYMVEMTYIQTMLPASGTSST